MALLLILYMWIFEMYKDKIVIAYKCSSWTIKTQVRKFHAYCSPIFFIDILCRRFLYDKTAVMIRSRTKLGFIRDCLRVFFLRNTTRNTIFISLILISPYLLIYKDRFKMKYFYFQFRTIYNWILIRYYIRVALLSKSNF